MIFKIRKATREETPAATPVPSERVPAQPPASPPGPGTPTGAAPSLPGSALYSRIAAVFGRLQRGETSDLNRLVQELLEADKRQAFSAILDFLGTGQDAKTG